MREMNDFLLICAALLALLIVWVLVCPHAHALAAQTNKITGAFAPNSTAYPATFCSAGPTGTNANMPCDYHLALQMATSVMVQDKVIQADATVCSGSGLSASCPFVFNWNVIDALYPDYIGGFPITSISNAANVSTAVMPANSPATMNPASGDWVCILGTSQAAYNYSPGNVPCWQLTGATYAAGHITQFTWNQTGNPPAATGGTVMLGCAAMLLNGSAVPCGIKRVIAHMTANSPDTGVPDYIASQSYANWATMHFTWQPNSQHPINDSIFDAGAGGFFHTTTSPTSTGLCTVGQFTPVWNTSSPGAITTDGNCAWSWDQQNALPQEAAFDGSGYGGIANTPASGVANINSTTCNAVQCTAHQIVSGYLIPWEAPYRYWAGAANASAVQYNATAQEYTQTGQTYALRGGRTLGGENTLVNQSVIQTAYSINLTKISNYIAGFAAAYIDAQFHAGYLAAGSPAFQLHVSANQYDLTCGTCLLAPTLAAASVGLYPEFALGSQGGNVTNDLTHTLYYVNDFIPLINQYGYKNMLWEQQTQKDSAGPGSAGCSSGQISTGNLAVWLSWLTTTGTREAEIYPGDLFVIRNDPNYVAGVTVNGSCTPLDSSGSYTTAAWAFYQGGFTAGVDPGGEMGFIW